MVYYSTTLGVSSLDEISYHCVVDCSVSIQALKIYVDVLGTGANGFCLIFPKDILKKGTKERAFWEGGGRTDVTLNNKSAPFTDGLSE